jgi:hypothetical protein
VVRRRRGASRLGCLFAILLVVTVAYFGTGVAEAYLRYYKMNDAMQQEARFAQTLDDDAIRSHLRALADSLGLPEEATNVTVRRSANRITIETAWIERVELPMMVREIHFAPHAERTF